MPTYVPYYYDNALLTHHTSASSLHSTAASAPHPPSSSSRPQHRPRPAPAPAPRPRGLRGSSASRSAPAQPLLQVLRDDEAASLRGASRTTLTSEYGCPASIIQSIARVEGVSPSALSIATILPSSVTTTDAILYYAYRYAKARQLRAPALVEALDFYSSSSASTSDSDATDDGDDDDDDDDDFLDDDGFDNDGNTNITTTIHDGDDDDDVDVDNNNPHLLQQTGPAGFHFNNHRPQHQQEEDDELVRLERDRRTRVPIPDVKLGLGVVAVTWPPPSEASAIAVSDEKRRRYDGTVSALSTNASVRRRYRRASPAYGLPFVAGATGAPDSIVVHVAHYTVGSPVATYNSAVQYRRVMVATRGTAAQLNDFLRNIIIWHYECSPLRNPSLPGPAHYALYRYVIRDDHGFWNREEDRRARLQGSVFLHGDQMKTIIADMRRFLQPQTRRWYRRYGLPQRRSYLFYGPPGTGKTSTIRVLASTFQRSCCFLGMASGKGGFSNQSLADALAQLPKRAIIVLEDVDALFNNRKSRYSKALTFSGLLNALDGVLSVDGVVTIMTTNHIERLDDALLRAGRVDRRFFFGPPSDDVLARMFRAFFYGADDDVVQRFVTNVSSRPEKDKAKSIATLQLMFIDNRERTAEECADGVDHFFDTYFPIEREREEMVKEEDGDDDDESSERSSMVSSSKISSTDRRPLRTIHYKHEGMRYISSSDDTAEKNNDQDKDDVNESVTYGNDSQTESDSSVERLRDRIRRADLEISIINRRRERRERRKNWRAARMKVKAGQIENEDDGDKKEEGDEISVKAGGNVVDDEHEHEKDNAVVKEREDEDEGSENYVKDVEGTTDEKKADTDKNGVLESDAATASGSASAACVPKDLSEHQAHSESEPGANKDSSSSEISTDVGRTGKATNLVSVNTRGEDISADVKQQGDKPDADSRKCVIKEDDLCDVKDYGDAAADGKAMPKSETEGQVVADGCNDM